MLRRIAITGPECSGKSWLAKKLANHYNTFQVPEYSVEYLQKKGAEYKSEDILNIAKGQLSLEEEIAGKANELLFCDTDLIVNKIWSNVVFGKVPAWIDDMVAKHQYDLYLLCFPDIAWQSGPFRESPENREFLFELYEEELKSNDFKYKIVQGHGDQRFQNAVNFVEEMLISTI